MSEFIKAEEISRSRMKYTDSSGRTFIHSKGTWAWRNNNPGNIRLPSKKNMPNGVIGIAGGFLVFSSYEAGFNSLYSLLKKDYNRNLLIQHGGIYGAIRLKENYCRVNIVET